jgi:hypothetical protein
LTEGENPPYRKLSGLQTHGGDAEKEVTEDTQVYNGKGILFQPPQTHEVAVAGLATVEPRISSALPQHEQQTTRESVQATNDSDERERVTLPLVAYRQSDHLGTRPLENHDQRFFSN